MEEESNDDVSSSLAVGELQASQETFHSSSSHNLRAEPWTHFGRCGEGKETFLRHLVEGREISTHGYSPAAAIVSVKGSSLRNDDEEASRVGCGRTRLNELD